METHTYKTKEPERFYQALKRFLINEVATGKERISIRKALEIVRDQLKVKTNNNDMTAFGDRARAEIPGLAERSVTRERGQRGSNKPGRHITVTDLRRAFAMGMQYAKLENRA